jgi:ATP-dependent exoDNAse (exonuclease V) beta subunit
MTVHRAKGLEFPVVILVDPMCNATGGRPSRHVDPERGLWAEPLCGSIPPDLRDAEEEELRRDREESVRLAYVAATRARDLLVVPGLGDSEPGDEIAAGWADVLHESVYPSRESRRERQPAVGCPDFGEECVFKRPSNARTGRDGGIVPGLHRPQRGEHTVVWWDPAVLALDVKENVGLRQESILVADESGAVAEESEVNHARWQEARADVLLRGGTPSLRVQSVTALAESQSESRSESELELGLEPAPGAGGLAASGAGASVIRVVVTGSENERKRDPRPGGARFGTLVHAILATVALQASAESVHSVARTQGRLVDATPEEVSAAAAAVVAALAHPLLERAARSRDVRRESPVLLRGADGSLTEGVIDLAFREEEGGVARWTVVDFKTDRDLSAQRARYEAQVRLYVDAVAAATGERAEGLLLVV